MKSLEFATCPLIRCDAVAACCKIAEPGGAALRVSV
jgi:hypothetical protein